MTLKDKLIIYVYNKNNQLENESETLRNATRIQAMDSLDHYEVMRDKIRINAWKEFLDELYAIIINCKWEKNGYFLNSQLY